MIIFTSRLVGGTLAIILSLFFITLNSILLYITIIDKQFSNGTYRIIKNMLLASIIQLFTFFVGGTMTLAGTVFNENLMKIFGSLLASGWFLFLFLSLTLALDRLVVFISSNSNRYKYIFDQVFIGISWLVFAIYLIALNLPKNGFLLLEPKLVIWNYQANSDMFLTIGKILNYSILGMVMLIYVSIFVIVVRTRKSMTTVRNKPQKTEKRLLIVAVGSFIYEITTIGSYLWVPKVMPESDFMPMTMNLVWLIDCGVFAMGTIALNTLIKSRIKSMFFRAGTITITSVDNYIHHSTMQF